MPKSDASSSLAERPRADRLTDHDRTEIVTRLAMYDTPPQIVAALAERNVKITRQAVAKYDPTRSFSVSARWSTLFYDTRKRWISEIVKEPIAHRAFRLRKLQQIFEDASQRGELSIAASILEQAAKEVGGLYTNKSVVDQRTTATFEDITPGEKRNMLSDRIRLALAEAIAKSAAVGKDTKH